MKLFIAVTHLHGSGHLIRSLLIADECVKRGHDVTVVSGGFPLAHIAINPKIAFLQLPPVRSNGTDFSKLLTPHGETTADYLADRATRLCAAFDHAAPDCVITEQYPFGRGSLRGEYQALVERAQAAAHQPLILASIRDVLEPTSSVAKENRTLDAVNGAYDGVLIHGDADFMPLQASWSGAERIRIPIYYTGYIAPEWGPEQMPNAPLVALNETDNILVSAGGGPLGARLFDAAMDCARSGAFSHKTWRFLVGGADRDAVIHSLRARAMKNIIVEPVRSDFFALYQAAHCALTRVGYNAFVDLCRARTPTVLCPFDEGNEREQLIRAEAVHRQLGLPVLPSAHLSGQALSTAMEQALAAPKMPKDMVTLAGLKRTVDTVLSLLSARA